MRLPAVFLSFAMAACLAAPVAHAVDDLPQRLDQAKLAYAQGNLTLTADLLQQALTGLYDRLAKGLAPLMPKPPNGWEASQVDFDSLGVVGGGLTVSRGYAKGDAVMNATLILDNPAALAASDLGVDPKTVAGLPGVQVVKIGGQDAILRWEPEGRAGGVVMTLGDRVLLQVDGSDISGPDMLVQLMKGWDFGGIRKQAGL
ncbi:MAG: hypothetical protein HQL40_13845 [Alphaproteobacteria bacterium]|nr:hypothetical protein [Alphaproteobacteria bacterium]